MEIKASKDLEENLEKIISDEDERTIVKKEIEKRVMKACDALTRKRKYMQENLRREVVAQHNNVIEEIVQNKMLHEKKENFSDVVKFEEGEYKQSVEKKNQHKVDQGHESQSKGPYKSHGGIHIQDRNRQYGRNGKPRGYVSNDYQRSLDKSHEFSPERRNNYQS
ncbi:hypothetical protein HCN44_008831 [Aphidius gifuensis]|uniref:Uncharacterized protein n=1 Tax=Aphidius gifuensis TaxID=684658 RepID=A0A834Y5S4_APHGI|nr:hypothetical protein HCN44_008831 [Aphidius gifuensis]